MLFPRYILNVVVLIIVVFGFGQNLKAQNSKYLDAVWTYDHRYEGINRPFTITVIDTAIFNGRTYLEIEFDRQYCLVVNTRFIRFSEDDSKVYYFDVNENKEYLLYDFGLAVGEIFEMYFNRTSTKELARFRLDSVNTITEFGTTYELQYFTQIEGYPLDGYNEVIKGVGGGWRFFFPSNGACTSEADAGNIRCFTANGKVMRFEEYGCNEIVGIEAVKGLSGLEILSASGYISFNGGDQTLYTVAVYDMLGKVVLELPLGPLAQQKIAVEELSSGMNVISVSSGSGASRLFKVWR